MGNILKAQGDNDGAKEKFNKVLQLSPDYSWAYFNLASIDYEEGDFDSAINNLEKTIELNPKDIDAYKIYAKILSKLAQYDAAVSVIEKAVENCGENGDLYYILAQIYKLQNLKENYIKFMNKALKMNTTLSISPKLVKKELDEFFR